MKKNFHFVVIVVFAACIVVSCRDLYRAGSDMKYLEYPIEDRLEPTLILNYLDTAKAYQVPREWDHFHLLDDLAPDQNKRVYFSEQPIEMYLLSFGGESTLAGVFDHTQISKGGWILDSTRISETEKSRIMNRLDLLLNKIEEEAKRKGLPDSVIYYQDPFRNK
jgi:hypothetical protein